MVSSWIAISLLQCIKKELTICRLDSIDWKHWRQSYKTLVLLEFLLTHGPVDFAEEFLCDSDVIEELGTFRHVDEKG